MSTETTTRIAPSAADAPEGITDIEAYIRDNGIHTVQVAFVDLAGALRGKRIPSRHFLRTLDKGIPFCDAVLGWDLLCDVTTGTRFVEPDRGFPDLLARAVPGTFRPVPWLPGTAFVIADLFTEHGDPIEEAPRHVLSRVVERANASGYRPKVGAELEFYLLGPDGRPVYDGIQCYSISHGTLVEDVLGDIRESLRRAGIDVEACGTEYGPAQIEINLAYGDALQVADDVAFFKNAVREIARSHGLTVTFMAKPWAAESGNSFHVHQSLWSIDDQHNLFDGDETLGLSYLAGLQATAGELLALGAPNVNSFKRFREDSFAPTTITWGADNRTTSTRSLLGAGTGSHVEHRTGSADANPYLVIAAGLAAGLHGISERLAPAAATGADAYHVQAERLPRDLGSALDLLERSDVARAYLGDALLRDYIALGRHEAALFADAVTDWERDRYLERV